MNDIADLILGVLSDSHGRVEVTRRAVAALRDRGAGVLLHLGDIETEEVLDELVGYPARIVFGNCDWESDSLHRYAGHLGIEVDHPAGELTVRGRRVVYTHGHLEKHMDDALSSGADYLLHGHSHELRDERSGRTRIINPGALFRAKRYTAALLDPGRDRLEIIEIPREC